MRHTGFPQVDSGQRDPRDRGVTLQEAKWLLQLQTKNKNGTSITIPIWTSVISMTKPIWINTLHMDKCLKYKVKV